MRTYPELARLVAYLRAFLSKLCSVLHSLLFRDLSEQHVPNIKDTFSLRDTVSHKNYGKIDRRACACVIPWLMTQMKPKVRNASRTCGINSARPWGVRALEKSITGRSAHSTVWAHQPQSSKYRARLHSRSSFVGAAGT